MKRVMLIVAYDGTGYSGWQVQPAAPTIEGELNKAIKKLTGEELQVTGASRTDAGVHGMGNAAVFDTNSSIPGDRFSYALNAILPNDIVVQESFEVKSDFHPRKCDCEKIYEYQIFRKRMENPLLSRYSWLIYGDLDMKAMKRAAEQMTGTHDYSSFCAAGAQVTTKVRTVYEVSLIEKDEDLLVIRVRGNGFLYNMIRIMAGTLTEVGRGHIDPEKITEIIAGQDRRLAGPTAPAKGLILKNITFLTDYRL